MYSSHSSRIQHWYPRHSGLRSRLSAAAWSQLTDRGSLTQRVRCACNGQFSVVLLRHEFARPTPDECQILNLRNGELALIREVQLRCDDEPWIFAHTVIPRSSLEGRSRFLGRLGTRPLGAALFADPTMRRSRLQLTELQSSQALYQAAIKDADHPPAKIPGRRSLFTVSGNPLLVAEYFLREW